MLDEGLFQYIRILWCPCGPFFTISPTQKQTKHGLGFPVRLLGVYNRHEEGKKVANIDHFFKCTYVTHLCGIAAQDSGEHCQFVFIACVAFF